MWNFDLYSFALNGISFFQVNSDFLAADNVLIAS